MEGASLAGVLAMIVVLGGLAAIAVIGANALTGSDDPTAGLAVSSTTRRADGGGAGIGGGIASAGVAACNAATGAADAASQVYFANSGGSYPTKWSDLTAGSPPLFLLPTGVVINPNKPDELDGQGWKLKMSGGGTTAPGFACTPQHTPPNTNGGP